MGEKERVIEVRVNEIRMAFAAMSVKAFEGELHNAMQVDAVLDGLRRSIKLSARKRRSSVSAFGSLKPVAWAYCVATVPRTIKALAGMKSIP